jgi:hypothetical protein
LKKFKVYITCTSFLLTSINGYAYDMNVGAGAYQNTNDAITRQNIQNATQNPNQTNQYNVTNPNNGTTFDPNANQHVNLNQEVQNAGTRSDTENQQHREQQSQQTTQQQQKAGGYADGALNSAKQSGDQATDAYNNSSLNSNSKNGSAYNQAQDGQNKADNGSMIGKVVGGAMVVAGGVAIAIGTGLMETIWGIPPGGGTIAVGAILVGMGGMELAQSFEDKNAANKAANSKFQLGGYDPYQKYSYDPKTGSYTPNPNYYKNPDGSGGKGNSDGNTTYNTDSTAQNGTGDQNRNTGGGNNGSPAVIPGADADTKMGEEFAKYGIGFDKKTQTVTLPDGKQFTINDIRKGKMPDADLQAAYNKAKLMGSDIATQELAGNGLGQGLGGTTGAGANGSMGFGNKTDPSSLAKVAGALKNGLGSGSGAGGEGAGGRGIASEDGSDGGAGGPGLRGKGVKSAAEQAAAARALAAKVAGLSTNYNGEPIGVSSDSIFEMIKRRYEMKDKENSFINDLINVTTN